MLNNLFASDFVVATSEGVTLEEEILRQVLEARFAMVDDVPGDLYVDVKNPNIHKVYGKKDRDNCIAILYHTNNKYNHLYEYEICWVSKSKAGELYECKYLAYDTKLGYSLNDVLSVFRGFKQPRNTYIWNDKGNLVRNVTMLNRLFPNGAYANYMGEFKNESVNRRDGESNPKRFRRIVKLGSYIAGNDNEGYVYYNNSVFVHSLAAACVLGVTLDELSFMCKSLKMEIDHIDADSGSTFRANRFTNLQLVTAYANQVLKSCRVEFQKVNQ